LINRRIGLELKPAVRACHAAKEIEPVSMTFTKASKAARFIRII